MAKKSSNTSSSNSELNSLRKEVAGLKRELAKVQKSVLTMSKPGKVHATKAVVNSLEVVNPAGDVVASIDNKGNLFCLTVWASTGKNVRGVFIDGKTSRKVSAGTLELIGLTGNAPALEANGWSNGGEIKLRDLKSNQGLDLQGSGAPLIAYEAKNGSAAVVIHSNSPAGGQIDLRGTLAGSKAAATLSVSHLTGAGAVFLSDSKGNLVAKLP
jgi:hypothetical protein